MKQGQTTALKAERQAALSIVTAFISVLLLVQLWLLTGAVEGLLANHGEIAFPATVVSGLCTACSWGLWRLVSRRFLFLSSDRAESP